MTATRVPFVPETFSILRPAMGKLAHEPGKTAATRANVRYLRRWLREILPGCANATPVHFAVLRTEHEGDRLKAVTQAVLPAQGSTPIPLVQGLRYSFLFSKRRGARPQMNQCILV